MSDSDTGYAFGSGIGQVELARLDAQSKVTAQPTRIIFAEAGLQPGMRVLDLGCGAGDSAFVTADLVGPGGSMAGLDHSAEALVQARLRAGRRGLAQVEFIEGDIHDPAPGGPYDAIVERQALWLLPDPAEVLRRQATVLRPGGLDVSLEADLSPAYTEPEMPLVTHMLSWVAEASARAGMPTSPGRRLWAIAEEAGLRPLGMIGIQQHYGPGDEIGLAFFVETTRGLEPLLVGTGVATAEEIGMETLEQRAREEWKRTHAVAGTAMLLGAWATTGPE
jgi:SAM-dependent methyltransferase